MFIDGFVHQIPDIDPAETSEWLDSLDSVVDVRGKARCSLPADPAHGTSARAGRRGAVDGLDAVHQHDPARAGAVVPGRRAPRAAHPGVHPVERGRDGRPGQPPVRGPRRPLVDVRVGRRAVRGRLQPLLPGQGRRRLRRPGLHAGPRRSRHLRPGVPRGPDDRGATSTGSVRRSGADCRATRTRGGCPTSGSSRRCRWGWARSTRSPRRASTGT